MYGKDQWTWLLGSIERPKYSQLTNNMGWYRKRRAAVSIPANIAEGAARQSPKEFAHFLSNAQGSASELETELLIAHRLEYLGSGGYAEITNELESVGRMLIGLARNVRLNFTSR